MWEKFSQSLFKKTVQQSNTPSRCVLYIDDNELQLKLIERNLSKKKYRVLLAENGLKGIEIARKEKPDIILLDIVLPGINGIEVCKKLKNDPQTKDIPVLFLSGSDAPQNILDCYEFGAENYLNKSISPHELVKQIELTIKEQDLFQST